MKIIIQGLIHEALSRQICAALYSAYQIPSQLQSFLTKHAFWCQQDDLLCSLIEGLEQQYPTLEQQLKNIKDLNFNEDEKQQLPNPPSNDVIQTIIEKMEELIPASYGKSLLKFFPTEELIVFPTPNPTHSTSKCNLNKIY